MLIGIFLSIGVVSIHALLAECDPLMRCSELLNSCFNPRTPCGVRRCCTSKKQKFMKFQSTHSLRSATRHAGHDPPDETFQSTHSLRSATLPSSFPFGRNRVSIHALLAECDSRKRSHADRPPGFNPRTPCGVRQSARKFPHTLERFQSTHSLRSATLTRFRRPTRTRFQSTHSLRSATGPDTAVCVFFMFQSTHSLRSATDLHNIDHAGYKVSIHALLAECDRFRPVQMGIPMGFNPRTPCGVRPHIRSMKRLWIGFQSTHSLRSATPAVSFGPDGAWFQSTHSLRSATTKRSHRYSSCRVSIHALLAECDPATRGIP